VPPWKLWAHHPVGAVFYAILVSLPLALLVVAITLPARSHPRAVAGAAPTKSESPPPPSMSEIVLPKRVTQAWLDATIPVLNGAQIGSVTAQLRARGWTDEEIVARVLAK
jgi:hypothetical protein